MRVAVRIPPCRPLPELAEVARRAEAAGFDTAAYPDSPTLYRDTIGALAFAARATERITIATSVTHFVTRDPIVLASGARSVAELAPGRVRISLGAGDSSAFLAGKHHTRTGEMREGVAQMRELWAGRPVTIRGSEVVLQDPCGEIPVYLAADGPKNLALAAEIADGVIMWQGEMDRKLATIEATIAATGRTRPLARVATGTVKVTDDVEREARLLKSYVLRYAQRMGQAAREELGFDGPLPDGNIVLPDGSDLGHPRDMASAAEFAGQWISDDFATWYATTVCYFGDGKTVAGRMQELADAGFDEMQVTDGGSFTTPDELIEKMGTDVIPILHG